MSFEQETDTIRRLQIAIRNSDMQLLKDASYKLYEKFHEGHKFEMLQELNQILMYVSESDIPLDIKEILCPTIEEILDKETSPENSNNTPTTEQATQNIEEQQQEISVAPEEPSVYYSEDKNTYEPEENPQIDIMPAPIEEEKTLPDEVSSYEEKTSGEEFENKEENLSINPVLEEKEVIKEEINEPVIYDKPVEIYEPTDYVEEKIEDKPNMQDTIETYQKQFMPSSDYIQTNNYTNIEPTKEPIENSEEQNEISTYQETTENNYQEETIAETSNLDSTQENINKIEEQKEENYTSEIIVEENSSSYYEVREEDDGKQFAIFYYDKKSSPLPTSKQIDELSDTLDVVDTDIYDFEKLLVTLKGKKNPPYIVTTSQSIKLSEFLIQENILFKIPFVPNTTANNADYEVIPMWGLSNMFKCQNCNSKILSYSFNNKVLSVKCSSCSGVMYPEMYSEDNNINPYYWQRAFGALASSREWILLNLPQDNDIIRDFIETVYQSAKPEKIYLYPANNYYEEFFVKNNPECKIISYQTQEKLLMDFGCFSNTAQV